MHSDYERNRFIKKYWIVAAVSIAILTVFGIVLFGAGLKTLLIPLLLFLLAGVLFIPCYKEIDRTYQNVEEISEHMGALLENEENAVLSELKEGSVGILYSNFDKMVQMFREGKTREQKEKEFLKNLISDISHQLKTPLASLTVFVDLLMDEKLPPEEQKQILKEAESQLSRMEWLVLSMLKQARIEAGVIDFHEEEFPLLPVISQVQESVQYLLGNRSQELIITCKEQTKAFCDPEWLTEALINLVKNASDYSGSGEGKRIWIDASMTDIYTRISVRDEGIGIEEKDLHHIFTRFYRADHNVNPNSVGIGLSLTKSIIDGMNGSISVRSEIQKGTEFIIILPCSNLTKL